MPRFNPTPYRWPEVFRFRHVKPGHVFYVRPENATPDVAAGHYVRATPRKALPCTYSEWSAKPHVNAADGVRYIPANLPVDQTQV